MTQSKGSLTHFWFYVAVYYRFGVVILSFLQKFADDMAQAGRRTLDYINRYITFCLQEESNEV